MSQTLVLKVPDEVYDALKAAAADKGQSPEAAGAEWLEQKAKTLADDPLDRHIGAYRSSMPGWSLRHHEVLGETDAVTTDHHFEQAGFARLLA